MRNGILAIMQTGQPKLNLLSLQKHHEQCHRKKTARWGSDEPWRWIVYLSDRLQWVAEEHRW